MLYLVPFRSVDDYFPQAYQQLDEVYQQGEELKQQERSRSRMASVERWREYIRNVLKLSNSGRLILIEAGAGCSRKKGITTLTDKKPCGNIFSLVQLFIQKCIKMSCFGQIFVQEFGCRR